MLVDFNDATIGGKINRVGLHEVPAGFLPPLSFFGRADTSIRTAMGIGGPFSDRNSPMTYAPSESAAGVPGWKASLPGMMPVGPSK
jgi:hypothetical protein